MANGWLVVLRLNVPVNNFQSCGDGAIASWVINQYFRGVKCLAQGHNTAAEGEWLLVQSHSLMNLLFVGPDAQW